MSLLLSTAKVSKFVKLFLATDKRLNSHPPNNYFRLTTHSFTPLTPTHLAIHIRLPACLAAWRKHFPSNLSLKLPIQNNLSIPLPLFPFLFLFLCFLLAFLLLSWHIQLLSFSFCAGKLIRNSIHHILYCQSECLSVSANKWVDSWVYLWVHAPFELQLDINCWR